MGDGGPVRLKMALGDNPHVAAVKSGEISIAGVDPQFIQVTPIIGAFRRMVRDLEFDVCEMAPTTYMIARSLGAPFIALPVFLVRMFHHDGIVCPADSAIGGPKDLEGKRVGVRAYSVTTGVWKRGIMASEYGLDCSKVTWVVDDEEAVPELPLPPNVLHAPDGESLVSLYRKGGLDAAFLGPAGLGRQGPPTADWNVAKADAAPAAVSRDIFVDGPRLEAEWHQRTGIYPHHGLLVVKDEVLSRFPWVAQSLFDAFTTAKDRFVAALNTGAAEAADQKRFAPLMAIVGDDPLPYGIEANRPSIEALARFAAEQGLLREPLPMERMFVELN